MTKKILLLQMINIGLGLFIWIYKINLGNSQT